MHCGGVISRHRIGCVVISMKSSSMAALKVVILTTFSAGGDENFVETMTFSFQWLQRNGVWDHSQLDRCLHNLRGLKKFNTDPHYWPHVNVDSLKKCSRNVSLWYGHVITATLEWAQWRLKSPASRLFTQPFIQTQIIKKNIKAPRDLYLWGEFTGDRWIPRTKGQWHGKCFHLMTFSWCCCDKNIISLTMSNWYQWLGHTDDGVLNKLHPQNRQ